MATLKPGFFTNSKCVEWTSHVPKWGEPATRSPSFVFESEECHFELHLDFKNANYELCVVNNKRPPVPFDVSVFVVSANNAECAERITVRNYCDSIWRCHESDLQIYLRGFCICFKIIFHRSDSEIGMNSIKASTAMGS